MTILFMMFLPMIITFAISGIINKFRFGEFIVFDK